VKFSRAMLFSILVTVLLTVLLTFFIGPRAFALFLVLPFTFGWTQRKEKSTGAPRDNRPIEPH
jgi:hypothetical protein